VDACVIVGFFDISIGSQSATTFCNDALAGAAMQQTLANLASIPSNNVSVQMTVMTPSALLLEISDDVSQAPPPNVHVTYVLTVASPKNASENMRSVTPAEIEAAMGISFSSMGISNTYSVEAVTAAASVVTDVAASQNSSNIVYYNSDYEVGNLTVVNHNPGGIVPTGDDEYSDDGSYDGPPVVAPNGSAMVGASNVNEDQAGQTGSANATGAKAVASGSSPSPSPSHSGAERCSGFGLGLMIMAILRF